MNPRKPSPLLSILRWSEKYTKTDMVYLVHGSFWLSIAQLTASVSGFIITIILANHLPAELLGEYRFLIAGFSLLGIIALPGMRTALRESTPKGYLGNLSLAFKAMFKWGVLASTIAILGAVYYLINDNISLFIGFLVIASALPFNNASTGYLEYLTALKKVKLTTAYTTLTKLFLLVVMVTTIFYFPNYSWILLAVFLFGTILPNILFHHKTVKEHSNISNKTDPGITQYALHISAMTALATIAGQLDKIFIWNVIGAEALALFYIAYTVPLALSQYLIIIPTLAFAKFGERNLRTVRNTLLPKVFKYLIAISLSMGVYILAAPYLMQWIFPQYLSAIPYSQALALIPIFGAFLPIKTYLTTLKATKQLYILSVVPPIIRIIVAVLMISTIGLWGAVLSLLAEGVVRSVMLIYFFLRTPK